MENIKRILKTVVENKGRKIETQITHDTKLRNDLGLDSLDLAELTVRIEVEYGIDIFEDGIVDTIGEILAKLEE